MRNLILSLLLALSASAAPEPLVVTHSWLRAHLNDANLVLLHVGDKEEYAKQHIPGARLISMQDVSVTDHSPQGLVLEMLKPDELRQRLESFGISNDSRIVIYYGKDWVSPTTRIIFTLDYAGLGDRVSLLDGGMREWVRAGNEVTTAATPPRKGTLAALKVRPLVVDAPFVRAHLETKGFRVIDGRTSVYYDGVETGGGMGEQHRTGHLPNAGSIPFTSITDERGLLLPRAQLQALFDKAGVKKGDTVVGYCHIGMQTTVMLFVARMLGHRVLLYDGSMQDWSRKADYPVVNPQQAAR